MKHQVSFSDGMYQRKGDAAGTILTRHRSNYTLGVVNV